MIGKVKEMTKGRGGAWRVDDELGVGLDFEAPAFLDLHCESRKCVRHALTRSEAWRDQGEPVKCNLLYFLTGPF